MPKQFVCEICNKSFTRSDSLSRHLKIHTDNRRFHCPHKCEGCPFRANQNGSVINHVRSEHSGERLPCAYPGCDDTFSDPAGVSRHQINIHGLRVGGSKSARCTSPAPTHKQEKSDISMANGEGSTSLPPAILSDARNGERNTMLPRLSMVVSSYDPDCERCFLGWHTLRPLRNRRRGPYREPSLRRSYLASPLPVSDQPRRVHPNIPSLVLPNISIT